MGLMLSATVMDRNTPSCSQFWTKSNLSAAFDMDNFGISCSFNEVEDFIMFAATLSYSQVFGTNGKESHLPWRNSTELSHVK